MTDHIASIAESLRAAGVNAIERNQIMSQIRGAIAHAGDHPATPLGDHLTAAQDAELTYAARLALASARRVGVAVDPHKGVTLADFDKQAAVAKADPAHRMAAKQQLAAINLLRE